MFVPVADDDRTRGTNAHTEAPSAAVIKIKG